MTRTRVEVVREDPDRRRRSRRRADRRRGRPRCRRPRCADPAAADPAAGGPADPEALFDAVERLPEGALAVLADGRELKISNWDKVLFPATGFTKGDLIAYYARIAPAVVPHVHDRPLTLKRYPNGVDAPLLL